MNDSEFSYVIRSTATRHEAPPGLRRDIVSAIRATEPEPSTNRAETPRLHWPEWLRLGSAFACGMVIAGALSWSLIGGGNVADLTDEAVTDHVRSLMAAHLTDVGSSDQHTVKPWFNGQLTYSPPVHDLSSIGFPLVGGRLDYLDRKPVAALVYRHRLHVINVFVRPCQRGEVNPKVQSRQGFNVAQWCDGRMQYMAVSDLNSAELQAFIAALHEQEAGAADRPSTRQPVRQR